LHWGKRKIILLICQEKAGAKKTEARMLLKADPPQKLRTSSFKLIAEGGKGI